MPQWRGIWANTDFEFWDLPSFCHCRFFGKGLDINQQEKKEFERVINRIYDEVCTLVISDLVPYLSFIPKLQGLPSMFENLRDEIDEILLSKIFEVEKHKQRAEESKGNDSNNNYVPDFIDVLLTKQLDDGEALSDKEISFLLLVCSNKHLIRKTGMQILGAHVSTWTVP